MKHPLIPITLTPENRAQWIKDNAIEVIQHVEKTELDEYQVSELEKKSSLASRAIDRLDEVKKEFMEVLKNGTHLELGESYGDKPARLPYDITIPPTSGYKELKSNRAFADKQIEQGFTEESVEIYVIPYPEESMMVAVDIEGKEWDDLSKEMTLDQINQHKPMLKKDKKSKKKNDNNFMEGDEEEDDIHVSSQQDLDL